MDNSRGNSLRIYIGFMIGITTIALVARFWSRWLCRNDGKSTSTFWWDDWLAFASFPFFLVPVSLLIYMVSLGLGEHFWDISPPNLQMIFKLLFVAELLYNLSVTLAKMSALFFYRRVFTTRVNFLKYGFWIGAFLVIGWDLSLTLATIFLCNPVPRIWNITIQGTCTPLNHLWFGNALSAIVVDLYILILPIPIIWSLKMTLKRKLWMVAAFVTGYSVVFITIGRLVSSIIHAHAINTDVTYGGIPYLFWTAAEAPASVIGVSLPAIFLRIRRARVYKHATSRLKSKTDSSGPGDQTRNMSSASLGAYASDYGYSRQPRNVPYMETLEQEKEKDSFDEEARNESCRTSDTLTLPDVPVSNAAKEHASWFRNMP